MEDLQDRISDSRRAFMKKSALASGALALGAGGGTVAAQGDEVSALAFADDYVPNGMFEVVGALESTLTLDLLQFDGPVTVPSPGDYEGYVINYGFTPIPKYSFLFVTSDDAGDVQPDAQFRFGTDASYFVGELNLVETDITLVGGGDGGGDGGGGNASVTGPS